MNDYKYCLRSTMIGDYCGSAFEGHHGLIDASNLNDDTLLNNKGHYTCTITDDSICTLAIAAAIMEGTYNWKECLQRYCKHYISAGYGPMFKKWILGLENDSYNSWGNGAAMRCSPIAFYSKTLEECDKLTEDSCMCTHNHPDAIKGAKALNESIFRAIHGDSKEYIKQQVFTKYFPEWLENNLTIDNYLEYFTKKGENINNFAWYLKCDNIVPMCICAFDASENFEHALYIAIAQGYDTDTAGAIISPLAYAYYKELPEKYINVINKKLEPCIITMDGIFSKYIQNN